MSKCIFDHINILNCTIRSPRRIFLFTVTIHSQMKSRASQQFLAQLTIVGMSNLWVTQSSFYKENNI